MRDEAVRSRRRPRLPPPQRAASTMSILLPRQSKPRCERNFRSPSCRSGPRGLPQCCRGADHSSQRTFEQGSAGALQVFESTWPIVTKWLDAEPEQTALQLLEWLQTIEPEKYDDKLLRTLQCRLKEWRAAEARRLVFGPSTMLGAAPEANGRDCRN